MTTPPDSGDRGSLQISDRVVERIAGHAVLLVSDAAAAPRRILGVNVGQGEADSEAHVSAKVDGGVATIQASIAVRWPQSVRDIVARTRQQIRDDVARLTDVRVDSIDLDVVSLDVTTPPRRRVA